MEGIWKIAPCAACGARVKEFVAKASDAVWCSSCIQNHLKGPTPWAPLPRKNKDG